MPWKRYLYVFKTEVSKIRRNQKEGVKREMWSIKLRYRKQWSSFEIIILGFAGVILAGALLLMLPVASREGNVTPYRNTVYCNISRLCDGTGSQRYRKLLVRLWTERDFAAHSDRWSWCGYDRCFDCDAFREKNFPDAAKHDAGCDFCPEGGRNCAPDAFYPQRNLWN